MTLRIRAAREGDAEALGHGFVRAFRLGDAAQVAVLFRENPHLVQGDTLIAEEQGVLAGQVTSARLAMMLAGAEVAMGGVTLVAGAPEHRQKGAVDRLMRALLVRARKRREPVSGLYPFHEPFYAKFGYARVEWTELFEIPTTQFPRSDLRKNVRRLDADKDFAALAACYARWREGRTGPLVRSEYWWKKRVFGKAHDGVVCVEPRSREVTGYLLYDTAGAPNRIAGDLAVKELVSVTPNARRALLGFVASLGDQFRRVFVSLPRGEGPPQMTGLATPGEVPFYFRHHAVATTLAGMMARVVDLRAALSAHPGPAKSGVRGAIGLDLTDPVFADQTTSFDLAFDARGASAKRARKAKARVTMTVGAFSQVYLAAARARDLLDAGVVTGHADAAALLDVAFAGPAPFLSELNGF